MEPVLIQVPAFPGRFGGREVQKLVSLSQEYPKLLQLTCKPQHPNIWGENRPMTLLDRQRNALNASTKPCSYPTLITHQVRYESTSKLRDFLLMHCNKPSSVGCCPPRPNFVHSKIYPWNSLPFEGFLRFMLFDKFTTKSRIEVKHR